MFSRKTCARLATSEGRAPIYIFYFFVCDSYTRAVFSSRISVPNYYEDFGVYIYRSCARYIWYAMMDR